MSLPLTVFVSALWIPASALCALQADDEFKSIVESTLKKAAEFRTLEEADAHVRKELVVAATSKEKAIAKLLSLLDADDRSVILLAAQALDHFGEDSLDAIPRLIELQEQGFILSRIENPMLRGIALRVRKLKTPPKGLIKYLRHKNPKIASWTYYLLHSFGERARNLDSDLIKILKDESVDDQQKIYASNLIAAIGPQATSAIPELIRQLQTEATPINTVTTLVALGPQVIPEVAKQLSLESIVVQTRALNVLGFLGTRSSSELSKVKALIQSTDASVQLAASRAYWRISGEEKPAIEVLKKTLHSPELRAESTHLIYSLREKARPLVGLIIDSLQDETFAESSKQILIRSLGSIGPAAMQSATILSELCSSESLDLRHNAAMALWQVTQNSEKPVQTLVQILGQNLTGSQRKYKAYAIQHLAEMGPAAKDAIPAIRNCLFGNQYSHYSAKALALIGGDGHKVLQEALQSDDSRIRRRAKWAMEKFLEGKIDSEALSD